VGSGTRTAWKRRARAASFSIYFRYSSVVVAPMQCSSPRARLWGAEGGKGKGTADQVGRPARCVGAEGGTGQASKECLRGLWVLTPPQPPRLSLH